LGDLFGDLTPRCPPIRSFASALNSARRDGNFEVLHVVVCRRFSDVASYLDWYFVYNGKSLFPVKFWPVLGDYSGVGSDMSIRPPKGTSLRQNTHFEPSCTFLRLSVRAGREPQKPGKKKVKKVTETLYFTYVPLEAGLTYRHGTSGEC
jgi:hypothetical protein